MSPQDQLSSMKSLFERSGFHLRQDQIDRFREYYRLIMEYNEECDLTRLVRFEDIVVKHFIDCMCPSRIISLPSPLLDVGTGAGFPGIPMKILDPSLSLVLAEPRRRRVGFLENVVRALDLDNVEIYPHLVGPHSRFEVDGVVTRALEQVDETLRRVMHFLGEGGRVVFMKGPGASRDLDGLSEEMQAEYECVHDAEYTLPETAHLRRLLVYRKLRSTSAVTYMIFRGQGENAENVITSHDNGRFREMKRISAAENIRKDGKTLVAGRRIVRELVRAGAADIDAVVVRDGHCENDPELNRLIHRESDRRKVFLLKKGLFGEIDTFGTGSPLVIVNIPPIPAWDGTLDGRCTLLVPFQDPANVGAVIRSAAGFGVGKVVMLKGAASPYHPRSVRSSGGAVFKVMINAGPSIEELGGMAERGLPVVALDRQGVPIESFTRPPQFALLPGIEGPGLPAAMRHNAVSIPISGAIESLNAAIAASIALYAFCRDG
jgi:16S rRNA (guanine527-N7)-methyltransferase